MLVGRTYLVEDTSAFRMFRKPEDSSMADESPFHALHVRILCLRRVDPKTTASTQSNRVQTWNSGVLALVLVVNCFGKRYFTHLSWCLQVIGLRYLFWFYDHGVFLVLRWLAPKFIWTCFSKNLIGELSPVLWNWEQHKFGSRKTCTSVVQLAEMEKFAKDFLRDLCVHGLKSSNR